MALCDVFVCKSVIYLWPQCFVWTSFDSHLKLVKNVLLQDQMFVAVSEMLLLYFYVAGVLFLFLFLSLSLRALFCFTSLVSNLYSHCQNDLSYVIEHELSGLFSLSFIIRIVWLLFIILYTPDLNDIGNKAYCPKQLFLGIV